MILTSNRGFAKWGKVYPDRRIKLPAATACRSHARARPLQGQHQLANPDTATAVGHQKTEPTITIYRVDH